MEANRHVLLFILLAVFLGAVAGCDGDGGHADPRSLYIDVANNLEAEWISDSQIRLKGTLFSHNGPSNDSYRYRFTIYGSSSQHGPWEEIFHREGRGRGYSQELQLEISDPSQLTFFKIVTRVQADNISSNVDGPTIATVRPLAHKGNWDVLPDLLVSVPELDHYEYRINVPVVSPDGGRICIETHTRSIFDLQSGAVQLSSTQVYPGFVSAATSWDEQGIIVTGNGLLTIDPETLQGAEVLRAGYTFRQDETTIYQNLANQWYVYDLDLNERWMIPAPLEIPEEISEISSITKNVDNNLYCIAKQGRYTLWQTWYLWDKTSGEYDLLSPVDETEYSGSSINFFTSWFGSYVTKDMGALWVSPSFIIVNTIWSGREEFWLVDYKQDKYYQLTGYSNQFNQNQGLSLNESRWILRQLPAYNQTTQRVLLFFPTSDGKYAIRAIPLPK
ncbi:MAG: hypothetical protein CL946_05960 [Ectothiorhodospiraceae bacterium]|nr:hypothetical protein [Ectothiorhodospiraceae bacterium]